MLLVVTDPRAKQWQRVRLVIRIKCRWPKTREPFFCAHVSAGNPTIKAFRSGNVFALIGRRQVLAEVCVENGGVVVGCEPKVIIIVPKAGNAKREQEQE